VPGCRSREAQNCRWRFPRLTLRLDSDRGVRWRLGCYPAVTPALELVRFALREPANGRCPSAAMVTCKLL
jgi:hypothetical protein